MLVIEGSDNLGKTTLAKKIVRRVSEMGYPVVYSWMTRPNEQLFDFFLDYKKMMNPYAVQDRFHLGGLAYHQDKITPQKLAIINGWIRSVGGLIIVLYAEDEKWYEEHIKADTRKNILDISTMCRGNKYFKWCAKHGDCDFSFNIFPGTFLRDNVNFVSDFDMDELIGEWINHRQLLGI